MKLDFFQKLKLKKKKMYVKDSTVEYLHDKKLFFNLSIS